MRENWIQVEQVDGTKASSVIKAVRVCLVRLSTFLIWTCYSHGACLGAHLKSGGWKESSKGSMYTYKSRKKNLSTKYYGSKIEASSMSLVRFGVPTPENHVRLFCILK